MRLIEIEDVLNNVVAEGILYKIEGALGDTCNESSSLSTLSMVDAALQDATAVTMSTNNDTVLGNSIVDEMRLLSTETSQALLDDMERGRQLGAPEI